MANTRFQKSILNARVGIIFYFLTLFFSFFSRKIFLNCLGDNFIGLTGTLLNILALLNLAELGIGTCISFFLFKPIQEKSQDKIIEIMSVFGYLYRKIGIIIGLAGIVISLFFPLFFKNTSFNMGIIYFSFFSYLGSSLIGYFINYREILLSADQKNYIVSAYFQTAGIIKTIVQIILAYTYKNLYLWISIEFLFGIIICIILNWKIDKEYPWLKTNVSNGKLLLKKYPQVITYTKQIFIQKIKEFILTKSDEIMIFAFVSLKMVAIYGNYTMILNKLVVLINILLDGISSGVGNLVAEGNKKNTMKVFWELMSIRYFIAGVITFSLYHLIEPFICWWLGKGYIMNHTILILLLINLFILQTRGIVDTYNQALGRFSDTWSAWAEAIINISVTFSTAFQWGIIGILLGKISSTCLIIILWKPYYLFQGLKLPIKEYWKGTIKYYVIFIFTFIIFSLLALLLPFQPTKAISQLVLYTATLVIPFIIVYWILLIFFAPGMRHFMNRFSVFNKLFEK
nr:sugar transporter [uncultured Bacteroides sp.]